MSPENHEMWAQLAAGHVLSALDEADEATYLEHAASCAICQQLEHDLSEVIADLASAAPAVVPPPSLKASIMRAVSEDGSRPATVIPMAGRRGAGAPDTGDGLVGAGVGTYGRPGGRARFGVLPTWALGVAAAVVALALVGAFVLPRHKAQSVAARCAAVDCPVFTLTSSGQPVAAVMFINDTAYIDPHGLPATPAGDIYVLWAWTPDKSPVPVAALHTVPTSGPVKAGAVSGPLAAGSEFAVSEERGATVPTTPSRPLLAQGAQD